jgi:hypothetical protein
MMEKSLSGKELKRLSAVLNERIASLLWLFGFSSAQWVKNTNREQGALLTQHSLMLRILLDRPELSPIPKVPSVQLVYALLCEIDPNITRHRMSTLVGLSAKSTARIFAGDNPTSTVGHMLLLIKTELERLSTKEEKLAFYSYLQENVKAEAQGRGYNPDCVWNKVGWSINAK